MELLDERRGLCQPGHLQHRSGEGERSVAHRQGVSGVALRSALLARLYLDEHDAAFRRNPDADRNPARHQRRERRGGLSAIFPGPRVEADRRRADRQGHRGVCLQIRPRHGRFEQIPHHQGLRLRPDGPFLLHARVPRLVEGRLGLRSGRRDGVQPLRQVRRPVGLHHRRYGHGCDEHPRVDFRGAVDQPDLGFVDVDDVPPQRLCPGRQFLVGQVVHAVA